MKRLPLSLDYLLEQYIDVSYNHDETADYHEHEQHYPKLTNTHTCQKAFTNNITNDRT